MTREETKELLMTIKLYHENFLKTDNEMQVRAKINAWHRQLKNVDYTSVSNALDIFVQTNTSGYAPNIAQLLQIIREEQYQGGLTDFDVWNKIHSAMKSYPEDAKAEYDKLPEELQRITTPYLLMNWARIDNNYDLNQVKKMILEKYHANREETERKQVLGIGQGKQELLEARNDK